MDLIHEVLTKTSTMKISEIIKETAGGIGTSAIAVAPVAIGGYVQKRNPDGTAVNALDHDNLLGGAKSKKKKSKKSKA